MLPFRWVSCLITIDNIFKIAIKPILNSHTTKNVYIYTYKEGNLNLGFHKETSIVTESLQDFSGLSRFLTCFSTSKWNELFSEAKKSFLTEYAESTICPKITSKLSCGWALVLKFYMLYGWLAGFQCHFPNSFSKPKIS